MFDRSRHNAVLLACLCLPLLAGCSASLMNQQRAQDDLQVAMQRAQVGKIAEARKWADRAIAVSPHDISTYVYAPTSADDNRLAIADPGGEQGVFTVIGDDADVVTYMKQAAAKFPDSPAPLQVLAQSQGRLGDIAAQRATASKLAALLERQMRMPGHALGVDLIIQLAQAYWDSGDAAKGASTYRRAISTYPNDPNTINAYNGLAYSFAVANDTAHLPEALTMAQTALKMVPKLNLSDDGKDSETGAIEDTIGWIRYRQGDFKSALVNVQKGVNANPRLAEGRYHLAMIYKALGNTDAARMELSYAVNLNPGYADALREIKNLPEAKTAASPVADGA